MIPAQPPSTAEINGSVCPLPKSDYQSVLLGHGSGGTLSADLLRNVFLQGYGNNVLNALEANAEVQPRAEPHHRAERVDEGRAHAPIVPRAA